MIRKLTVALAASLALVGGVSSAEAKTTLKLATVAPPRSPWGQVFSTWAKAVDLKTNGEVQVIWLWNGTAGPEGATVGKIKSGQLSGAAVTAVGLSQIHKPLVALQLPGAFASWKDLDNARNKLAPEFDKAMREKGFLLVGHGDVGVARFMSKGFAVRLPGDLKGKHPAVLAEDVIYPKVYETIGGVSPVPASVMGFLPKLNSGAVNVLNTPSLAAEQLQWASRVDHINTLAVYHAIGAIVMNQAQLDKLPGDQREHLANTGKKATQALTDRIRQADNDAFGRLKKKMKTHNATPAEQAEWQKVFKEACRRLKSALPGDVLGKIGAC